MRKIISILFIICICIFTMVPAYAADTSDVDYGNAFNYIFTLDPHVDLFKNFKKIMPGDHKVQVIALQNTEKDKNVTIYMRAECFKEYEEFLSWMTLKIYKSETIDGPKTLLSQNHASDPGDLVTDIKLATIGPDEHCYITVILDVDHKMNNSMKLKEGMIRWIFSAEEELITTTYKPTTTKPSQPTTKPAKNPFTGSDMKLATIAAAAGMVSIVTVFVVLLTKKDKKYN